MSIRQHYGVPDAHLPGNAAAFPLHAGACHRVGDSPRLAELFQREKVNGTFVVHDVAADIYTVHDRQPKQKRIANCGNPFFR